MKSRRAAVAFFVALCLVLCGMVLRRQIAAHPLPPKTGEQAEYFSEPEPSNIHPAKASTAREAKATVQGQLDAFRAGDGAKAMAYQSRRMRSFFVDPIRFEQMIAAQYPEFAHSRAVQFGPIWSDPTETYINALVIVEGADGRFAQGSYQLIREEGKLRINDVHVHGTTGQDLLGQFSQRPR